MGVSNEMIGDRKGRFDGIERERRAFASASHQGGGHHFLCAAVQVDYKHREVSTDSLFVKNAAADN